MTNKKFITFLAIKIFIYTIISAIASTMLLADPIITNELALGQMRSSDELYLLMEMFVKSKQFISLIYGCITTIFVGTTIYEIYQFIKTGTKENY